MLGLPILDVAIGVIFTYLVLSLVVTTANELIASLLKRRQRVLWDGIRNLLADEGLATKLYDHPLISSLRKGNGRPSYIPSRTFVLALLDTVTPVTAQTLDTKTHIAQLRTTLAAQQVALPPAVTRTLLILLSEAGENLEHFKKHLENWFNESMDRVSGWYKRGTQAILLTLAILLTIGANADTLTIIATLWQDPTVRTATVAQAQSLVAQPQDSAAAPQENAAPQDAKADAAAEQKRFKEAVNQLQSLPVPIGWSQCTVTPPASQSANPPADASPCLSSQDVWPGANFGQWSAAIGKHWQGWLLTALAISLGAPFWFDMLSKVAPIRSSGKTPEKAAEETKET